jgi:RHS repeat-associated protein
VRPPGRSPHEFAWTDGDLLASSTAPGGASTTYAYNDDRQLTAVTLPTGEAHTFSYDAAGRLDTIATPGDDVALVYDGQGRLGSIADSGGVTVGYGYDGRLPTSETWSGAVNGSVTRTFDNDFRVTGDAVAGGPMQDYTYDDDSLITGAGAQTIARDGIGLVDTTDLGVVHTDVDHDQFGEPTHVEAWDSAADAPLYTADRTYDDVGRIVTLDEVVDGDTMSWAYTYDDAGRLATVTRDGDLAATYSYDLNGNRTQVIRPTGTESGTYDGRDRLVTYAGASFDHDDAGALRSTTDDDGTTSFHYDTRGNLLGVDLPDGTEVDYRVDGDDRRVERRVDGVVTQRWLYDGQLRPIAELDAAGALVSRFVYAGAGIVPDHMIRDGVRYRIVTDHLGSPRLVVDSTDGTIVQRLDYDEFGRVLADTNPGFQPFGFGGGLYDPSTGLVRFGARDYDSRTGRWTLPDPAGFAGGQANLYQHALGDPVNNIDWTGRQSLPTTVAMSGAQLTVITGGGGAVAWTTSVLAAPVVTVVAVAAASAYVGWQIGTELNNAIDRVWCDPNWGCGRSPDAVDPVGPTGPPGPEREKPRVEPTPDAEEESKRVWEPRVPDLDPLPDPEPEPERNPCKKRGSPQPDPEPPPSPTPSPATPGPEPPDIHRPMTPFTA